MNSPLWQHETSRIAGQQPNILWEPMHGETYVDQIWRDTGLSSTAEKRSPLEDTSNTRDILGLHMTSKNNLNNQAC